MRAFLDPRGRYSPGAAEWSHLERARALGIPVPEPLAAGERIGPWARLQSYLLIAELTGQRELNELLPAWHERLPAPALERRKRHITRDLAVIVARLHRAGLFHKDLYLCHVFAPDDAGETADVPLALIDLHRLAHQRLTAWYGRWKDLGQLLFSTYGVAGITDRDRLRFWAVYRRETGLRRPGLHAAVIRYRAARYHAKDRANRGAGEDMKRS